MDVKALKLSKTMEDMIKAATLHEVRGEDATISGEITYHGMRVVGRSNTIVALLDRGLVTFELAGCHWLTEDGLAVRAELTGESLEAPSFPSLGEDVTPEDHPTESDMITGTERQAHAETMAQSAAMQHYRNATSEDVSISAYDSPQYRASKELMMLTGTMAYPDLTGEEVYELIHSFNEGESLRDLVDIYRFGRDSARLDDESVEPEVMEQMRVDSTGCDDCKGDHDVLVPCRIHRDPIAYSEHIDALMSDVLTNELPGDAERAWDAENAAMEAASIRAEYEGESVAEFINGVITADDIMVKTPRTFVSMNYLNTMRRISEDRRVGMARWRTVQQSLIEDRVNLFALIDSVVEAGKIGFGMADREKRKIMNTCRPTIGVKHKPSKRKR